MISFDSVISNGKLCIENMETLQIMKKKEF